MPKPIFTILRQTRRLARACRKCGTASEQEGVTPRHHLVAATALKRAENALLREARRRTIAQQKERDQ